MKHSLRRLSGIAALSLAATSIVSAQVAAPPFAKGERVITFGAMAGGAYDGLGGGAMVEWGVASLGTHLHLGVGAFVGAERESDTQRNVTTTQVIIPLMATGNVHFTTAGRPKLDSYFGASLGLLRTSADITSAATGAISDLEFGAGLQAGARYWLSSRVNATGQVGVGDVPLVFAGLGFRF
jgi:hypothetical protein